MTAGEYCNREIVICEQTDSVTDAAILMRQQHVGDLVVVESQGEKTVPVGIITDRDIVIEVIAQKVDPNSLCIKDVMSTKLVTISEKATFLDTLELMRNQGIRRVIVIDEQGSLQGLLSADDAIELIAEEMSHLTKLVKQEISREENEKRNI